MSPLNIPFSLTRHFFLPARRHFHRAAFLLLMITVMFQAASSPVSAQSWARVDMSLLLVLHPTMASFDYSHGRFLRPSATSARQGGPDIGKALQEAARLAQPKIRQAQSECDRLRLSLQDTLTRREETIRDILEKEAGSRAMVRDRDQQIREYESRYEKALRETQERLSIAEQRLEQANEIAYAPLYFSREETERQMQTLRKELLGAIAQEAQRRGVSVVIDPTMGLGRVADATPDSSMQTFSTPDIDGLHLFRDLATWGTVEGPQTLTDSKGTVIPAEAHVAAARNQQKLQQMQTYLGRLSFLPSSLAGFSLGSPPFLAGGIDLTEAVADGLFRRYQVPANIQVRLIALIRSTAAR
ncbi:MAG: hypothetical protein WA705_27340 [Candidatus Ozemobacteraceae bacterium]